MPIAAHLPRPASRPGPQRRPLRLALAAWLLLAGLAGATAPPATPLPASGASAPTSRPEAVARVVLSLLSYARWPTERETLRLCVDGGARYAGKLMEGGTLSTGRLVDARRVDTVSDALVPQCDALYLGAVTEARRRPLAAAFVGKPVLVVAEEDFECEGSSMFCLNIRDQQVSFRIHLEAIARSGIHVHPGVLQLGRRKAPAP